MCNGGQECPCKMSAQLPRKLSLWNHLNELNEPFFPASPSLFCLHHQLMDWTHQLKGWETFGDALNPEL